MIQVNLISQLFLSICIGTFNLSKNVSPELPEDEAQLIDFLETNFPNLDVYQLIIDWSRTQSLSIGQQACAGIRMFDVRVCYDYATLTFRAHHLVMSQEDLVTTLEDVSDFVNTHPQEIVILSLSHFFGMNDTIHQVFINHLSNLFGKVAMPFPNNDAEKFLSQSIQSLIRSNQRVLMFYDDDIAKNYSNLLVPTYFFNGDWANVDQYAQLIKYETTSVQENADILPLAFYYPQWILTDTPEGAYSCLLLSSSS